MNLSKQSSAKSPMQSGSGTADSDSHRATQSATNGGDASESIGVETGARKPLEKRPFSSVQSMEADCENDQNKSPNSDVCDYHSKAIPTRYSSTGCEGQIASKEIDGRAEDERGKDQRDIRTAELDGDADNDMTSTASVVTTSSKVITTDRKWVSEESDDEPGFVTSGKQTTIWTANEGHQFAASSDTSAVTTTTSLTTSSASITSDYHHHTSSTSMTSDTSHRPTTSDVTTARKPGVGRNACSCHGEKSISSYSENCVNDNDKDNNDYGYRHPFPPYSARGKAETCSSSGISGVTCSPSSSSFSSALLDEGNKREEGGLLLRGSVQDVCRPLSKTEALDVVWTIYPPPAARLPERSSRWIRPVVDGVEAWSFLDDKLIKATDFKVCLGLVVKARLEREGVVTIPSDVRAGVEEVTSYDEAMQKIEEYLLKKSKQG